MERSQIIKPAVDDYNLGMINLEADTQYKTESISYASRQTRKDIRRMPACF